ncbi:MAG: transketolase family protein [Candidatus Odinarchaeia archaeon]
MRTAFINTLMDLAEKDNRIFLLTGDLGFSVLEKFQRKFPDRFFNMGVAEQNMIGVATGLALSGKVVFVYSIIPFVTMRCFEQVRNDVCYQNQNVKIVGIGSGLSYGSAGPTHHAITDIAIMRALPNMIVVCPGDPLETEMAIKLATKHLGPVYIRLGRSREPKVHTNLDISDFEIGKGLVMRDGKDITLIATGNLLYSVQVVADRLLSKGIDIRLISMHTVKPIDRDCILESARKTNAIFAIEEHSIIGGLGSAVAEVLAESPNSVFFRRFGIPDTFASVVGSQAYLRERVSLSVNKIEESILEILGKKR